MKAYIGKAYIESEHNFQRYIIYAGSAYIAKMVLFQAGIISTNSSENFEIHRERNFDDSENASHYEITKLQWKLGWKFYGMNPPDPETSIEKDYKRWYQTEYLTIKSVDKKR